MKSNRTWILSSTPAAKPEQAEDSICRFNVIVKVEFQSSCLEYDLEGLWENDDLNIWSNL